MSSDGKGYVKGIKTLVELFVELKPMKAKSSNGIKAGREGRDELM